jgi:hypothetical protein
LTVNLIAIVDAPIPTFWLVSTVIAVVPADWMVRAVDAGLVNSGAVTEVVAVSAGVVMPVVPLRVMVIL